MVLEYHFVKVSLTEDSLSKGRLYKGRPLAHFKEDLGIRAII